MAVNQENKGGRSSGNGRGQSGRCGYAMAGGRKRIGFLMTLSPFLSKLSKIKNQEYWLFTI